MRSNIRSEKRMKICLSTTNKMLRKMAGNLCCICPHHSQRNKKLKTEKPLCQRHFQVALAGDRSSPFQIFLNMDLPVNVSLSLRSRAVICTFFETNRSHSRLKDMSKEKKRGAVKEWSVKDQIFKSIKILASTNLWPFIF